MPTWTPIDLDRFPRRSHFLYFSQMANPYVGVTAEVDITDFLSFCHSQGYPFSLSFLYCVGRAANGVPQLRQRILSGSPVEYAFCETSHTVLRENGTYGYCRLNPMVPFDRFLPEAQKRQQLAREAGDLDDGEDALSLLFLSSLPWVRYSALVQPTPVPADSNPRITWGKYEGREGRTSLPVTLLAHHGLVDGVHIGAFYAALEAQLQAFCQDPS